MCRRLVIKLTCGSALHFWLVSRLLLHTIFRMLTPLPSASNNTTNAKFRPLDWPTSILPIPVAVVSKVQVCPCFTAGIAGSDPAEGIEVHLLCLLCRYQPIWRADHSSRGVLPGVGVCMWSRKVKWHDLNTTRAIATQKSLFYVTRYLYYYQQN